jgi:hypothetical protein
VTPRSKFTPPLSFVFGPLDIESCSLTNTPTNDMSSLSVIILQQNSVFFLFITRHSVFDVRAVSAAVAALCRNCVCFKAVVQLLMVTLATCDLLLLLSTFWTLTYFFNSQWTLGTFMCKLELVFGTVASDCLLCTIAFIAVDRWVFRL